MKNVTVAVKGNIATITVDLSKRYGTSASGKNEIVASTGGNQVIPGKESIKFGLNVYTAAGENASA